MRWWGRELLMYFARPSDLMAKSIKLSGREMGVMRTIGFGLGASGGELAERTQIAPDDLCDTLNALIEMGYVETRSMTERVLLTEYAAENFEVNPSYANDLKEAMKR